MRWHAAEQLLERDVEPELAQLRPRLVDGRLQLVEAEPYHQVAASMESFLAEQSPCACAICRPDLAIRKAKIVSANRKRASSARGATAPISELADALTEMRRTLIATARFQLKKYALDEELAEDLVQEAIARLVVRAPEYRGPKPLFGWLRKTVTLLARERVDRKGRPIRDLLDVRMLSLDEPWARV
jgi:hypothetical protein